MANPFYPPSRIASILFDINGTLRRREPHLPTQEAAKKRILGLLKMAEVEESFWYLLASRRKAYSRWAQANLVQLPEEEIWKTWLLPELPQDLVAANAAPLSLALSKLKGAHVPLPGATETLVELKKRGYQLGVISNTMFTLDVPTFLKENGWDALFQVVILSSVIGCRKPAPEIFLESARRMAAEPGRCAFVGNRISRDLVGCKNAGYALGILIEPDGAVPTEASDGEIKPDLVLHSLQEILQYFPGSASRPEND